MTSFTYKSGQEVRTGDQILYHGEPGTVDFLVIAKTGDAAKDWYIDRFPGGGFMVRAKGFGDVFVTGSDTDEDLEFVARTEAR